MILQGVLLIIFAIAPSLTSDEYTTFKDVLNNPEDGESRQKRLFQVLQIVRFPNEPCQSGTANGTCYTSGECEDRGGKPSGTCASSYGVCCIFSKTCGQMTNENCTYFTNPVSLDTNDDCRLEVCACGDNICQLRLDFESFSITGPSTSTNLVAVTRDGTLVKHTAANVDSTGATPVVAADSPRSFNTNRGQCLTDSFSLTSPGNNVPPVVCGDLTGEHMYVDLDTGCCNDLNFDFLSSGVGTTAASTRQWNIKLTQYSCDYNNLAPPGCTQYFFGSQTGTLQSYNFPNQHLANQEQTLCVRREKGFCRICYVPTETLTAGDPDFDIGGIAGNGNSFEYQCAGYGLDGANTAMSFDHLSIPIRTTLNRFGSQFCGNEGLRSVSVDGANVIQAETERTVCSLAMPFRVTFRSDAYEDISFPTDVQVATDEAQRANTGFRLGYTQVDDNCALETRVQSPGLTP